MKPKLLSGPRVGRAPLLMGNPASARSASIAALALGLLLGCGGRNPEPEEPHGPMKDLGEEADESQQATGEAAREAAEETKDVADQVEGEPAEPDHE